MPKSKGQKKQIIDQVTDKLKVAKGVVFSSYIGLKVSEMEELRKKLRAEKSELIITKKTLLKQSLQEAGKQDVPVEQLPGGVALILGADEVSPAKVTAEFAKTHELVKFAGGILENKFIDLAQVKALATLPSKQELLGKLVGTLQAPISGFVNVCAGNLRGLVTVLNRIKEIK